MITENNYRCCQLFMGFETDRAFRSWLVESMSQETNHLFAGHASLSVSD
jgi:hypothetical protein